MFSRTVFASLVTGVSLLALGSAFATPAAAQERVPVQGQGCYTYGDQESPAEGRQNAREQAKMIAIENYKVLVEGLAVVEDSLLAKQLSRTLAAGSLYDVEFQKLSEDGRTYCVAVTATVDPEEVDEKIEEFVYQGAVAEHTPDAYRSYLGRYPKGRFADEAKERIAALSDEAAWDAAAETNTPEAYREYLTKFPNGQFADEANARIASLIGGTVAITDTGDSVVTTAPLYLVTRTTKVRKAPYLGADVIEVLEEGSEVNLTYEETGRLNWYRVQLQPSGQRGYVTGNVFMPLN